VRAHSPEDWDGVARRFETRVCHVLAEDRNGVLAVAVARERRRLARRRATTAIDFGCGIGRALPLLAQSFDRVIAVDGSAACLDRARARTRRSDAIEFVRADLARERLDLPKADVALCVNVALTPNVRDRRRILENAASSLSRGGRLLLVVPALESDLLVRRRILDLSGRHVREKDGERVADGIVDAGGVLTKHWTREEILLLAPELGCEAISIERVEYAWSTEIVRPPRSFRDPYPWDWLAVLERRSWPAGA
jgi:SAM-dependent methyltransferase